MIYSCEHLPKLLDRHNNELSICADCKRKNVELFHRGDSENWYGMRHYRPKTISKRARAYRYQSLREPTKDDL